jgi:hypothetical protein|tara:strand:+ start:1183 stop:2610 length:1428 start_codon:yes stop_codon:yes gene_type:complete
MGATKVQKIIKSLGVTNNVAGPELILPNNSGDHQNSIKRNTPTKSKDLTNKEYVDLKADGIDPDHTHSKLIASDGSPNPAVSVDADGNVAIDPSGGFADSSKLTLTGGRTVLGYDGVRAASYLQAASGKELIFETDGANERMRIEIDGSIGFGKVPDAGTVNTALPIRLNNNTQIQWDRADGSPVNIFNVDASDNLIWKLPRSGKKFTVFDPNNNVMLIVTDVGTTSETYFNGAVGVGISVPYNQIHVRTLANSKGITLHRDSTANGSNIDLKFLMSTTDSTSPVTYIRVTRLSSFTDNTMLFFVGNKSILEYNSAGYVNFTEGGLQYGEIYCQDANDTITITTAGKANKVQITSFDTNGQSNGDVTPDHTNDHITVGNAGKYMCTVSTTVESTGGSPYQIGLSIFKNNGATEFANLHAHRNLSGSGSDVGSISISGIIDIAANDTIELWVWNETNTNNIIVDDCTLTLTQIGGT